MTNEEGQEGIKERSRVEEVEVVCMSPNGGNVFTTTVNLSQREEREAQLEDRTSENSAIVRAEVRKVFEEQTIDIRQREDEMEENNDGELYECDLERARKTGRHSKGNSTDKRNKLDKQQQQVGERKRHRSGTCRSRSNSNDRRRQHSKQR